MAMPSARATHEPSRKRLGLSVGIAIALSGCNEVSVREVNQELRQKLFQECLKALPAGPSHTRYNDWDEVVDSCESAAYYQSRQCISGPCLKASGIAARSDETRSGSAEGKSPSDAPNNPPNNPS